MPVLEVRLFTWRVDVARGILIQHANDQVPVRIELMLDARDADLSFQISARDIPDRSPCSFGSGADGSAIFSL